MKLDIKHQPKYLQLKDSIIKKIRIGEVPNGSFLPSENELTKSFGVGRTTVRNALRALELDGILTKQQGRRSIVNSSMLTSRHPFRIIWLSKHQFHDVEPARFLIYNSLLKEAEKRHQHLLFISLINENDVEWFVEHTKNIDGIVFAGVKKSELSQPILDKFDSINNMVSIDTIEDSPANNFISTDEYYGGRLAARHLLDCGYRNIVMAAVSPAVRSYLPFQKRIEGFKDELIENGIFTKKSLLISDKQSYYIDAKLALEKLFADNQKTEAVFAITDEYATRCIHALQEEMNFRVPEDIAVLGYDGLSLGNKLKPRLSTVAISTQQFGIALCDFLQAGKEKTNLTIKPVLVQKDSTKVIVQNSQSMLCEEIILER